MSSFLIYPLGRIHVWSQPFKLGSGHYFGSSDNIDNQITAPRPPAFASFLLSDLLGVFLFNWLKHHKKSNQRRRAGIRFGLTPTNLAGQQQSYSKTMPIKDLIRVDVTSLSANRVTSNCARNLHKLVLKSAKSKFPPLVQSRKIAMSTLPLSLRGFFCYCVTSSTPIKGHRPCKISVCQCTPHL